jgi:hypothetical protein
MTSPVFSSPTEQSVYDIINQQLTQWGIGSLASDAANLIKQGLDANAVTIELQNTPAYQQRFAGNAERIKNGLNALSPADYVATEAQYRQVLRSYGLPSGFYDSQQSLNEFIAKDVSPSELNSRAQIAQQVWLGQDQEAKDAWRQFYGLSDGAAIASILDPDTALPIVQRMANAAQFGGDALRQGLTADQQRLEQYSDQGFTRDAVDKGLAQTALEAPGMAKLAQRYGQSYDQGTALDANIGNNAAAQRARSNLIANENSLFAGRAMTDQSGLSRNQSGAF